MSKFAGLYDIRLSTYEDKNFILSTFLRGLYYGNSWFKLIPKDIFMKNYKVLANELVNGKKTIIKVACLKEDPSVILGYSILSLDQRVISWVFVKSAWRGNGIAKSLLPDNPNSVSHLTGLGYELLSKFENKPIFDPFTF